MSENRRRFLARLGVLPAFATWGRRAAAAPGIEVRPTALYAQPDGRANLVRITIAGLDAPATRARVTDRSGGLVGTAGLLPADDGAHVRAAKCGCRCPSRPSIRWTWRSDADG